ncbi:alpha-N-acetyl-neuraminyl-2,3-beta-galactosyl-1,3-N-acetyl-galactosaminide alpha-2,6-sialyltransferase [Paramormyrops kingsleyae]|uniref:Uncharacterized protein n=1 Tax=Paramormyrops kingsleyae TaxID=1676925 RepID=A0A3B3QXI7_9TELE|nr:alpha-N-acetylgalactosaminide alpha-2,6-sialyltransferase 3-like [Paramormyrops kingsleyae]XP_023663591.1 alpha-N-acetylgalactosaminide alpha-2,6-sialyltransferase 3-like [Paramormyrops kingsleyae]
MKFQKFPCICAIITTALSVIWYIHITGLIGVHVTLDKRLHGYIRITPVQMNQYLDIHPKECALVSSSGQMLKSSMGKEIDQAEFVIRMNNAPTVGYEQDVGSRTNLRVVSHTSVPLLLKKEKYYFQQSASTVYVVWGPEKNMRQDGKGRIFNALWRVATKYPNVKLYVMTRQKIQYCDSIFQKETGKNRMRSGAFLSTGFFTMVLAMEMCDSIQVYGMIDDNYCSKANHTVAPYHYYEKYPANECSIYRVHERAHRGGHRYITEKTIYGRWASQRKIRFKHPAWTELEKLE